MAEYYTGPVCYMDGWHYTVIDDPSGAGYEDDDGNFIPYQVPDERLVCEDTADGLQTRYRLATKKDTASWHDRKHGQIMALNFEDSNSINVSNEEGQKMMEYLQKLRSGEE